MSIGSTRSSLLFADPPKPPPPPPEEPSTALGDLAAADGVALPLMLGSERPIRGEGSMPLWRLAYSSERPILIRSNLKLGVSLSSTLVAQVLADVHGEGAGAAAEADALRAVLPPVAGLAEEGLLVLAAVGLVPLETTGEDLLGGVDALLALAALGYFGGLEGHLLEILHRCIATETLNCS
ncbi:hypothetical protein TYRP_012767 [Tyrophagus putrescentiae]|nr:hypothetical protein TYRP_012767 [Tyrophagus putrescentiae]